MSVERNITLPPELQEIKEASRALVKAYGGQEAAAKRLGTRQQRLSDCCSTTTDAFMRADEIATLEAETVGYPGHPHVTSVLARQRLRELVPTPTIAATGRDLLILFAKQSKGSSKLAEKILDAHEDDHVDADEAAQIEAAADQVIATALAIRSEARMIQREHRQ
jgi:hypothetical protein